MIIIMRELSSSRVETSHLRYFYTCTPPNTSEYFRKRPKTSEHFRRPPNTSEVLKFAARLFSPLDRTVNIRVKRPKFNKMARKNRTASSNNLQERHRFNFIGRKIFSELFQCLEFSVFAT